MLNLTDELSTQPFLESSRNAPPLWGGALRDDTKNGCVADSKIRVRGRRRFLIRKEKVADLKIFGYVWRGPKYVCTKGDGTIKVVERGALGFAAFRSSHHGCLPLCLLPVI